MKESNYNILHGKTETKIRQCLSLDKSITWPQYKCSTYIEFNWLQKHNINAQKHNWKQKKQIQNLLLFCALQFQEQHKNYKLLKIIKIYNFHTIKKAERKLAFYKFLFSKNVSKMHKKEKNKIFVWINISLKYPYNFTRLIFFLSKY